ncbi:Vitamin D3 receptor B, partial [Penaeus vannamei]
ACVVCGDHAPFLQPSAALVCDSCRAFFWRSVVDASYKDFACANSWGCMVTVSARRACQACRFFSCLRAGMDISRAKGEEDEESPGPSRSPHASPSCVTETTGAERAASTSRGSSRTSGSLGPSEPPVSPHLRSSHSTIPLAASHLRAGHHSSGPRAPGSGPTARVFVSPDGAQRSVITSSSSIQDPLSAPIKTEDSPSFKYPARSVIQSALGSSSAPFRPPRSQERRRKPAPGAASSDPGEAASSGQSNSTATPPPVLNMKDLESLLTPEDFTDLRELEESYHRAFENISLPMENRMIKPDELSKLYSFFIKRRANFLVSTLLYSTLAPADRPKLLRIAVSMCTYITGAHLMDTRNYMWPKQGEALASPPTPMLTAATIRQYLSHEQFIRLMRFYVNYSSYYCDERIAIMMQVLSLAYPETGLADPAVVEEGRRRYGGLLSRYLLAVYGPEAGVSMFRALLSSQVEMRQLVEINQHVELVPRVSRQEDVNAGAALNKGIQLVCDGAMEIIDQLMRQQGSLRENGLILELQQRARALAVVRPEGEAKVDDPEHLVVIKDVLRRLANCNDPKLLADARRIIPTDRLKQFHKMLE